MKTIIMKTIKKDEESMQGTNTESFLKKKKKIKREKMEQNTYHNISEEKKLRLKGYQKNSRKAKMSQCNNQ